VIQLPEESNDQTQYSKTIEKLKEHIKTAYEVTYLEITSIFTELMTQPTARLPFRKQATEVSEKFRNEKLKIFAEKIDAMEKN